MASLKVAQALQQISKSSDKARDYNRLLSSLQATANVPPADLTAIVDSIFHDSLGIVATRSLLTSLTTILTANASDETRIEVGTHLLDVVQAQASSFEEQVTQIRILIATAHESEEEFHAAAIVLAGISIDSSQRKITPDEKARIWIRITRNYLEIDDTTSAEIYLKKVKNVFFQIEDKELKVHFYLSEARIYDAQRQFLSAAVGYQNVSNHYGLAEEEQLHTLSMAIKCAVLAPAGPARSERLKSLVDDERTSQLEEYGILEKMLFDRLVEPSEVVKFAQGLQEHQLARTSDGSTVLAKAMREHNLLAVSRLYSNIRFDQLGLLLGVDSDKAEETTARMIEQGRLVGRVDQIEQIIWFESGKATGEKGSARKEGVVGGQLRQWDSNVEGLVSEVEKVTTSLQMYYPDFVRANLFV